MAELEKKVKIVNLVGKIKKGRKTEPMSVTKELYAHLFATLPQYLLDVHKYTNTDKDEKIQLLIKTKKKDRNLNR